MPAFVRLRQNIGLGRMNQPFGEFVVVADMVEMRVAGHRTNRSFDELGDLAAQADDAHSGIDEQVMRPATHMPDVAAIEWQDVRFMDMRDPVPHRRHLIPSLWGSDLHAVENSIGPAGT